MKTPYTLALSATLLGLASLSFADDDIGPDQAVKLVEAGTIMPFDELNEVVLDLHPDATVEETELELEYGLNSHGCAEMGGGEVDVYVRRLFGPGRVRGWCTYCQRSCCHDCNDCQQDRQAQQRGAFEYWRFHGLDDRPIRRLEAIGLDPALQLPA